MTFNDNGYLPAGFHDWTLGQVDTNLVQAPVFARSQTRRRIAEGYSQLIAELARAGLQVVQWLGGSFCTAEANPVELDLVSLVDKDTLENLAPPDQVAVERLFLGPGSKDEFLCESYLCVILPPGHPNYEQSQAAQAYWRGFFGFDRLGIGKGIVRVQAGFGALYPSGTRGGV